MILDSYSGLKCTSLAHLLLSRHVTFLNFFFANFFKEGNSGGIMRQGVHRCLVLLSASAIFVTVLFLPSQKGIKGAWVQSVDIQWTVPSDPDVWGYQLHLGMDSRDYYLIDDLGNLEDNIKEGIITYTLTDLYDDEVYYVAVSAYDYADNESDYSNEKMIVFGQVGAAAPPSGGGGGGGGGCGMLDNSSGGGPQNSPFQIVVFFLLLLSPVIFLQSRKRSLGASF